jgi:hypothetical protein
MASLCEPRNELIIQGKTKMRKLSKLAMLVAATGVATFSFVGSAKADILDAPDVLSCTLVNSDSFYRVDWDDAGVTNAAKYAVAIECADASDSEIEKGEFDTGTGDCDESGMVNCSGKLATDIEIDVTLIQDILANNPGAGDVCFAHVRALHAVPSSSDLKRQDASNKPNGNSQGNHGEGWVECDPYPVLP